MNLTLVFALFFVSGFAIFAGTKYFIKSSENLASLFGIKKYIVYITVIIIALTLPQLVISIFSMIKRVPRMAVGTIIGYNVATIGLMFPVLAFVKKFKVKRSFVKFEIIILILVSILFWSLSLNKVFGFYDTIIFFTFFALFYTLIVLKKKNKQVYEKKYFEKIFVSKISNIFLFVVSFILTASGSIALVLSSLKLCDFYNLEIQGFSITVIPMVIIVPILIQYVIKYKKGSEISLFLEKSFHTAVFNLIFIPAVISLINPVALNVNISLFHSLIMIAFTAVFLLFLFPRLMLTRARGIIILTLYLTYLVITVTGIA